MKKIIPVLDNVLVKPSQADAKTASGIILPDSAKEKPTVGEVIAVGSGRVHPDGRVTAMIVKKGQKIYYKKWGGTEIKIDGIEYTIISQEDIVAIVEDQK